MLTDDNRLQPTVKTGHVGKTKLIKSDTNPAKETNFADRPIERMAPMTETKGRCLENVKANRL